MRLASGEVTWEGGGEGVEKGRRRERENFWSGQRFMNHPLLI